MKEVNKPNSGASIAKYVNLINYKIGKIRLILGFNPPSFL